MSTVLLLEEGVELDKALTHGERSAHRPLGVVLVDPGYAENGHNCVARILLDGAPEAPDLLAHLFEEGRQELPELLGIVPLSELRRARQICEEHRDDLALFASGHGFTSEVSAAMLRARRTRAK